MLLCKYLCSSDVLFCLLPVIKENNNKYKKINYKSRSFIDRDPIDELNKIISNF